MNERELCETLCALWFKTKNKNPAKKAITTFGFVYFLLLLSPREMCDVMVNCF